MSFENMSAENRNNFNMQRCCSFCRRTGHRINYCNDERLNNFETMCTNYINENGIDNVHNFLLDQAIVDPNLIKAFAIKNCGSTTRYQIDICIERIVEYFRIKYENDLLPQQEARVAEVQRIEPVGESTPASQEPSDMNLLTSVAYERALYNILRIMFTSETLNESLLFMEMINAMGSQGVEIERNRKFNIKTEIIENQAYLGEQCECDICYESCDKTNFIKLNCEHEFCKDCLKKTLQNEEKILPCCAFCREEITTFELRNSSIKDEFMEIIENVEM
jgi:hypothetical protein